MKRTVLVVLGTLVGFGFGTRLNGQQASQSPAPAAVAVKTPARESFHIYLLMGQSNMVGRDIRSLGSQVDNPHVLALNSENQWVVAREPIHAFDGRIPSGQGPGIPFALEMLKAGPDVTIGLIPCAVGGTPLRRWVKGGDLYENCVARAKLAGPRGRIEGALWHQGEADTTAQADAESYETRLVQMFRDLRADLNLPDLTIVVGQLGPFLEGEKYPYLDTVRAAIRHMPADLPHVGYADSSGLHDKGDKLHFDAASQGIFGTRYAKAMQAAAAAK